MSHEAAVGKIAQEEINYLMSRGLSEDEATSTIVRGFLNVDIPGLPPQLKAEIDRAIEDERQGCDVAGFPSGRNVIAQVR